MNAIVKTSVPQQSLSPVLRPQTYQELERFAVMAAKSTMVPRDFVNKPENIMVAVQMGSEVGLSPLQALQNIAVINGRPSIWGDAVLGLCRSSTVCEDVVETMEGEGDSLTAICVAKRRSASPVTARFSVADAKKAALWGKQGPWQQYPTRMLQMRARGFALRDAFPDVLRGLITAEEAADTPVDSYRGTTIQATAEPIHDARMGTREAINASVPLSDAPKRPTVTEWLDTLEAEFKAAQGSDAVDAILARDDVQKAQDALKNGARERLNAMIKDAMDRTNDGWPGPTVDGAAEAAA